MACVLKEGNFIWEAAVAVVIAGGQCWQVANGEVAGGCSCEKDIKGEGRINEREEAKGS